MTPRAYSARGHSVLADAGVGDQSNECRNGTPRCPGPDANVSALPCGACFLEADDDQDDEPELIADGGQTIEWDPYVGGTIRTYCRYCHEFAVFELEEDGRTCRSCERFIRTLGRLGSRSSDWGKQFQSLQMANGTERGGDA